MKAYGIIGACGAFRATLVLVMLLPPLRLGAATVTWRTPSGTNYWDVATNWVGDAAPTNGDDVVIATNNIGVWLTNSTYLFSSLLISNKANLIFYNWATTLNATNVTIGTNATLTCSGPFTTTSNGVWLACSNLVVNAGGSINVDARGFSGGGVSENGYGPGGGKVATLAGSGGGYGGRGGNSYQTSGGANYGSVSNDLLPGSGGAGRVSYGSGGAGGGLVVITAAGAVSNDGIITANGGSGNYGAGSGGGVSINCRTLTGSGVVRANGRDRGISQYGDGGGGGGRIAVIYDSDAQSALPQPALQFAASGGTGYDYIGGDLGTLYFSGNAFLTNVVRHTGQWIVPGFSAWSVNSLLLSNVWIRYATTGFQLNVTGDITGIGPYARLDLYTNSTGTVGGNLTAGFGLFPSAQLTVGSNVVLTNDNDHWSIIYASGSLGAGGDLILTNSAVAGNVRLYIYSASTSAVSPDYGALVSIGGALYVGSNAWIYPYSSTTNGGSAFFRCRDVTLATGGGINADGRGFAGGGATQNGYGPGGGYYGANYGSGGGYGGQGGRSAQSAGGATYGDSNAPVNPGSGGAGRSGYGSGGYGGGLVRIEATNTVQIDGAITADGETGTYGAGSGGGIFIRCRNFVGAVAGSLTATGGSKGDANNGAGGGGRIAVWRMYHTYQGTSSVAAGSGGYTNVPASTPRDGTMVWGQIPVPGAIFTCH
ncbi:MAG: hypothetical protein HYV35_02785 [Lentisphaerae bacterium]|nr:hypothetical protein [Lentisphaerota bacterium]